MGQTVSADRTETHNVSIPRHGTLTGFALSSSATGNVTTYRFGNVPYAAEMGLNGRFKKPKPIPEDFDYTGEYYDLGLKCPQPSAPNPLLGYEKSPSDENVQFLNIWVPSSNKYKPKSGWPVYIHIHGGWLQNGTPSSDNFNTNELFDDEDFSQKAIVVTIGYRLNIFGFLSCKELLAESPDSSNFGFWDQRLAIEWVYKYIEYFGGNPEQITLGGLSAGAYSTFFQLTYELYHPEVEQIIKQVVLFSNTPFSQPKTIAECQDQFNEVIEKFGIEKSLSGAEKLNELRKLDSGLIEDLIPSLERHTFRAVTEKYFVPDGLIDDINSGEYAKRLTQKNIRIVSGDVNNEQYTYSIIYTPTTVEDLVLQVQNYYPEKVAKCLLDLYMPKPMDDTDPEFQTKLIELYGKMIADGQVYAASRGFIRKLVDNGFPQDRIFRYRISFRSQCVDSVLAKENKVPHGGDTTVWFYALRLGYTEGERKLVNKWLQPYIKFLSFEDDFDWDTSDIQKFRHFKEDGSIEYMEDPVWDWSVKVAQAVYDVQI